MSMAAEESSQSNIIIRYIGTTPDSSQVRLLLHSVCQQICTIYGCDSTNVGKVCTSTVEETEEITLYAYLFHLFSKHYFFVLSCN